tara:strand:+ start:747 stop:863 length:117 start_codon:yes stop_codon:yes gene_type:complete
MFINSMQIMAFLGFSLCSFDAFWIALFGFLSISKDRAL